MQVSFVYLDPQGYPPTEPSLIPTCPVVVSPVRGVGICFKKWAFNFIRVPCLGFWHQ